jgi:hypothetical protein
MPRKQALGPPRTETQGARPAARARRQDLVPPVTSEKRSSWKKKQSAAPKNKSAETGASTLDMRRVFGPVKRSEAIGGIKYAGKRSRSRA